MRAALAVCLLAAVSAEAEQARYVVRGSQLPVPVAVNGYSQTVIAGSPDQAMVEVSTQLTPVGATGSYRGLEPRAGGLPDGFALPARLGAQLRSEQSAWEAATGVLRWVALELQLDEGDGPQDATSVLNRRSGRCSGLANAAAALLLAAGFEARTVSGILVTERGVVPHRWLECRLPGAGWVPTDPTLGLWVVTSRHLAFAGTVNQPPSVETVAPATSSLPGLPRWRGRPCRPNEGAGLVCRLVGTGHPERAVALLYGYGGEIRSAELAPEGRFDGLLPGRWRLVVIADGVVVEQRELELEQSQIHSFAVERSRPEGVREVGS